MSRLCERPAPAYCLQGRRSYAALLLHAAASGRLESRPPQPSRRRLLHADSDPSARSRDPLSTALDLMTDPIPAQGSGFGNVTSGPSTAFIARLKRGAINRLRSVSGLNCRRARKSAPVEEELSAPEFVRRQLGAIDGGLGCLTQMWHIRRLITAGFMELTCKARLEASATGFAWDTR